MSMLVRMLRGNAHLPKIIDHDERREQVAEATWRGHRPRRAGQRNDPMIADEAGYSTGAVHHYFANKDELILFAMTLTWQRTDQRLAEPGNHTDALSAISAAAREILPLDEVRRQDVLVWLAFAARAVNDEHMAKGPRRVLQPLSVDRMKLIIDTYLRTLATN
jgi:AcrR family transcriptional regulator